MERAAEPTQKLLQNHDYQTCKSGTSAAQSTSVLQTHQVGTQILKGVAQSQTLYARLSSDRITSFTAHVCPQDLETSETSDTEESEGLESSSDTVTYTVRVVPTEEQSWGYVVLNFIFSKLFCCFQRPEIVEEEITIESAQQQVPRYYEKFTIPVDYARHLPSDPSAHSLTTEQFDQLKVVLRSDLPKSRAMGNAMFEQKVDDFAREIEKIRNNMISTCDQALQDGLINENAIIHIKAKDIIGSSVRHKGNVSFIYEPGTKRFFIRTKRPLGKGTYKEVFPLTIIHAGGEVDNSKVYIKARSSQKFLKSQGKNPAHYNPLNILEDNIRREANMDEEENIVTQYHEFSQTDPRKKYLVEPTLDKKVRGMLTPNGEMKHYYVANRYVGSLQGLLNNLSRRAIDDFGNNKVLRLMDHLLDAFKGVAYIHENNYVHLDLKPDNLFIGQDFTCMVGDFGLSRKLKGENLEVCAARGQLFCTQGFRDPQSERLGRYEKRSDVYSLGATVRECRNALVRYFGEESEISSKLLHLANQLISRKKNRPDINEAIAKLEQIRNDFAHREGFPLRSPTPEPQE